MYKISQYALELIILRKDSKNNIVKGEPELTDPFNLLINVKLRMLLNSNFFYLKEHFYGNIVS